jgi:hypothetical protein
LDEFCKEVIKEDNTRNIYQQVIFKDDKWAGPKQLGNFASCNA